MTARLILTYPNPLLRKVSEPVLESEWDKVPLWCQDIKDTVKANAGLGLAAPQVGIHKRIFVIDVKDLDNPGAFEQESQDGTLTFINPILNLIDDETSRSLEACLSVPNAMYVVKRSPAVNLVYTNLSGEEKRVEILGEDAVVIQHEFDHLNGKLFIDRLNPFDRKEFMKRFEKPRREKTEGEINQIREQKRARTRKNRKK